MIVEVDFETEIADLIESAEERGDIRYVRAEVAREGDRYKPIGANSRSAPPELAALVSPAAEKQEASEAHRLTNGLPAEAAVVVLSGAEARL